MSPKDLVIVPKSIHQVLDQVRSKIFLTNYNPTGARLGNKYLRKKTVGHHVVNYYPPLPLRPALLNKADKGALYPGWTGRIPVPATPAVASTGQPVEGNAAAGPSTGSTPSSESSTSSTLTDNPSTPSQPIGSSAPGDTVAHAKAQMQAALREAGIKPDSMFFGADNWIGPVPPDYLQTTQWQLDPNEVYRIEKLEKRRRIGKTTPKKGTCVPLPREVLFSAGV